jgi:HK97 family phage prohead protease
MTMRRKDLVGAVVADSGLGERQIKVVVSTPTPDRVRDIVVPEGGDFGNYQRNPIVLRQHDPSKPVGTAVVEVKSGRVEALITFAPVGASAVADETCALCKSGVLSTVSAGFSVLDEEPIKGGGFRIKKWELLEISIVTIPANPDAVTIERSASPSFKVGASRAFDIANSGDASAEAILKLCGFVDGQNPDAMTARKGFLVYDASNTLAKGGYSIPFAAVDGDKLVVTRASIAGARKQLSGAELPDDVKAKALAVLDAYEQKAGAVKASIKGLYDVGCFAGLLMQIGWAAQDADAEREWEGDESQIPEMLAGLARQGAEVFMTWTQEELDEFLARLPGAPDAASEKSFQMAGKSLPVERVRAGRMFSASNAKAFREHCGAIKSAHDGIVKMLDDAESADEDAAEGGEPDDAKKSQPDMGVTKAGVLTRRQRQVMVAQLEAEAA